MTIDDNKHYKTPELLRRMYSIADHYGAEAQIDQTLEELAELATALCHFKKHPKSEDILNNVHEEMADVYIMIQQLMHLIDPIYATMGWVEHKLNRQEERIKNEVQDRRQDKAEDEALRDGKVFKESRAKA